MSVEMSSVQNIFGTPVKLFNTQKEAAEFMVDYAKFVLKWTFSCKDKHGANKAVQQIVNMFHDEYERDQVDSQIMPITIANAAKRTEGKELKVTAKHSWFRDMSTEAKENTPSFTAGAFQTVQLLIRF